MNNVYYIREKPNFLVEFQKNKLHICVEKKQRMDKYCEYESIKSVCLEKEIDVLPYITRNVIASLIIGFINKRKPKVLIIETQKGKDKIELKNCDIKKVKKIIEKVKEIIKENVL